MQPESRDAAYLWDMLDAARAIQKFVMSRSFEDYGSDRMLRGAVGRHLEIIGEAANSVSRGLRGWHNFEISALAPFGGEGGPQGGGGPTFRRSWG